MNLVDIVNKTKSFAKDYVFLPDNKRDVKKYLTSDKLSGYFSGKTEKEKEKLYSILEKNIDNTFDKYQKQIDSVAAKIGTGAGLGAMVGQVFGRLDPLIDWATLGGATATYIAGKTALELNSVYGYMKNTKDLNGVYGLAKYGLMKSVGMAVPFLGVVAEGGALKRMILERVVNESKNEFLKDIGEYKPLHKRVLDKIKDVTDKAIKPLYTPAYSMG